MESQKQTTDATIFVVDDDHSVRRALKRLLRANGFEAVTFENAQEFLEYPAAAGPSCLILDLRMPGLSGDELQAELRQKGRRIPIIFLSGHGDIPASVRAIKNGAADFLTKPVDDQQLLDVVAASIKTHREQLDSSAATDDFLARVASLTSREHEVMLLVVQGLLNKQIASELGVTEATVKVHRGRVMEKTGANSIAELVRLCERSQVG